MYMYTFMASHISWTTINSRDNQEVGMAHEVELSKNQPNDNGVTVVLVR